MSSTGVPSWALKPLTAITTQVGKVINIRVDTNQIQVTSQAGKRIRIDSLSPRGSATWFLDSIDATSGFHPNLLALAGRS